MTSSALFNNKGGVGKTTLTYHLAHMIRRLGLSVLAVDLDPQANLTSMCLEETEIEELWEDSSELTDQGAAMAGLPCTGRVRNGQTIADAVRPILEGTGDIAVVEPARLQPDLWLLPGSLDLSRSRTNCPTSGHAPTRAMSRPFARPRRSTASSSRRRGTWTPISC
ncbi:ParA family protein [Streptomyces sp. ADMS]|uniref:ParA family protein n=1 Tax=Streptomyces sp. ADMS TaxID=3071415 RepID=UPI00296F53CD|nr:ParA family protein [Streptomyces sp. ADMS]MDW4906392.1 ParA family protein [Streptomyces sp. ADMS]